MRDVPISCYATALALNYSLVKIEKEKGLDYAQDCCDLLRVTDYYLDEERSAHRFYTCDLPAFIEEFRHAVELLPSSTEYKTMLPKSDLHPYVEAIAEHAKSISQQPWVSRWKEEAEEYFQRFDHLVKYSHKQICDYLQMKPEPNLPTAIISALMPFGLLDAWYDENTDVLVLLTTGKELKQRLYVEKRDRGEEGCDPYEGYGWPKPYPEMVYTICHEVAHRCLHLSIPSALDSYLHEKRLEEDLCKALALDVMLHRTEIDRKLTRKKVYRLFGKEFGPHYIYLKDRK